ncbi:hypothetical protein BGW36DRAFT_304397, partial [Talaromyces proteolyticus]
ETILKYNILLEDIYNFNKISFIIVKSCQQLVSRLEILEDILLTQDKRVI